MASVVVVDHHYKRRLGRKKNDDYITVLLVFKVFFCECREKKLFILLSPLVILLCTRTKALNVVARALLARQVITWSFLSNVKNDGMSFTGYHNLSVFSSKLLLCILKD